MNPVATADHTDLLPRGALRHDIVKRLLAAIFQGELRPNTRLVVQKLAARFGISSTPVREALLELEALGLAQFAHNRGALVRPFGPKQLQELFQIRRILETEATRHACGRVARGALETLKRQMLPLAEETHEEWSQREMETDRRLHELITAACASDRLVYEIQRYATLIQTIREIIGNRRRAQELALSEHLAILDALLIGNAEAAAALMAQHIQSAERSVAAVLFSDEGDPTHFTGGGP